jgi:DNA-binding transcriptional LysR family regulator
MNKLESISTFVHVVEAGGFAAAARKMSLSRSAVNKHVLKLEEDLGVQLLSRSTRRVRPTPTGQAFYERCVGLLADLEEAERAASDAQEAPKGILKVNGPMSFGVRQLAPLVSEFLSIYPDIEMQLTLTDRFVDLVEEGYDLLIRISEPREQNGLITEPIADVRRVICAAPSYLRQVGRPDHPRDLTEHRCLNYGHLRTGTTWRLSGPDGEFAVNVKGPLCSNNAETLEAAAIQGLGIVKLPTFAVGKALRSGALEQVLPGYNGPQLVVSAVYLTHRQLSAKVRTFVRFLRQRLAPAPWEEGVPKKT